MCLPLTWAGFRTPSSEASPSTLCKLTGQRRREQDNDSRLRSGSFAVRACTPYVLSSCHGFPDVVHLFHRHLLPPDQLALVHVSDSDAVPLIPQIRSLDKQDRHSSVHTSGFCIHTHTHTCISISFVRTVPIVTPNIPINPC